MAEIVTTAAGTHLWSLTSLGLNCSMLRKTDTTRHMTELMDVSDRTYHQRTAGALLAQDLSWFLEKRTVILKFLASRCPDLEDWCQTQKVFCAALWLLVKNSRRLNTHFNPFSLTCNFNSMLSGHRLFL